MENKNNVGAASMEANEVFDFRNVDVPVASNYLRPGYYFLNVKKATFVKPEGTNSLGKAKTPYLEVEFGGPKGSLTEKFYITVGAMPRLQYLHRSLVGKDCDKTLPNAGAVGIYYEKVVNDDRIKAKTFAMTVGGKEGTDMKIYASLPYSNFIVDVELAKKSGFEEREFAEGSSEWNMFLQKNKNPNPSVGNNSTILPDLGPSSSNVPDPIDDMPF